MTSSPGERSEGVGEEGTEREWHRALALALFLSLASVVGGTVLVAVPFILLVAGLPVKRAPAFLVALLAAFWLAIRPLDGFGYVEWGWALLAGGTFVALSLAFPRARLSHRTLGAVMGAGVLSGVAFLLLPGSWSLVDWWVRDRMTGSVAQVLAIFRRVQGGEGLTPELEESLFRTAEVQADLFPAVLGLTTLAGLALSWWLYKRLAAGERGALGRLREFRFEDQLVWIFIGGLLLVAVAAGEGWTRAGSNTLVFMGALYALRGAAVLLFLNGGLSVLGGMLLAAGMLFMAPVLLATAVLVGLGDTWLDVRTKVRALIS